MGSNADYLVVESKAPIMFEFNLTADYRLVVICSKKDEDKSHIITRLHNCRRPVVPLLKVGNCRKYLKAHFVHQMGMEVNTQVTSDLQASMVDPDKYVFDVVSKAEPKFPFSSCVRVVSSTRSGMGKSLYIKRMAASLRQAISSDDIHVTIPIHGPVVTANTLMDCFKEHTWRDNCTIYHLDIAPGVSLILLSCLYQAYTTPMHAGFGRSGLSPVLAAHSEWVQ